MSELLEQLRQSFADEEYRNSYAESFMNSYVAAQIKVLREEYPLTQDELADKIGTQQSGVARFENVNYSSWKVETLRKIARALRVRLKITFEEFGTLSDDIEGFKRDVLLRAPFDRDPVFYPAALPCVAHEELAKSNVTKGLSATAVTGVSAKIEQGVISAMGNAPLPRGAGNEIKIVAPKKPPESDLGLLTGMAQSQEGGSTHGTVISALG